MNFSKLLILLALCSCVSAKTESFKSAPAQKSDQKIVNRTITSVQGSSITTYYDIPDVMDEYDPENTPNFKAQIKDPAVVTRLKEIIASGKESYTATSSKRCLPIYTAAVVFREAKESETVLFSDHCAILKIRSKNMYLDYDKHREEVREIFKNLNSIQR